MLRAGYLSARSSSILERFIFHGFWQLKVFFIAVPFLDINALDLCIWFYLLLVFLLGISIIYFPCADDCLLWCCLLDYSTLLALKVWGCFHFGTLRFRIFIWPFMFNSIFILVLYISNFSFWPFMFDLIFCLALYVYFDPSLKWKFWNIKG